MLTLVEWSRNVEPFYQGLEWQIYGVFLLTQQQFLNVQNMFEDFSTRHIYSFH